MGRRLGLIGGIVTLLYLAGLTWLLWGRLGNLSTIALNEVGDFLAGAFGPVAFLWLVLGFLQQGKELRISSEALRMQADELKASVFQQTELVKATNISLRNHEISLEPLLQVRSDKIRRSLVSGVPKELVYLSIVNAGAYCEHVVGRVFLGDEELGASECSPLSNGGQSVLSFEGILNADIYYDLRVSYVKSNGVPGVQEFEVRKFLRGDLTLVEVIKKLPELAKA
ncbi:hypothetical protein CS390_16320 [Pseudomonas sp. HLS-6]|uniref:hypothetical protein n=1 Tax=Pseudomonas sp. HLS-6 TaxID=2049589 RepID=UPI000C181DC8|nr:hypothetical protein [Pseudomonas sp. HLS-6]ATR83990.1 hypothetical protein CS390_16320 [Pseudomonas sp. HLS-6]